MRLGAADCLIQPFGPREVRSALGRVVEPMAGVAAEERNGHEGLAEEDGPPEGNGRHRDAAERLLGGGSEAIRELRSFVRRVASSEKPVLLLGESGSGKEMAARAVHELSSRVQAPFAAANCSAIPESLFETEMFGAERGAYTDAVAKPGHLEAAADGTVFLDEIGEMSAFNQAKLLRVIEERRVRRVGGVREIPLMFRVVAASNRNLPDEVAAERFRADLFYRLGVLTYRLPSLEERVEDIPELAVRFLRESGFENLEITDNAFDRLCEHTWPGNVRELRNVVDRAAVLRRGTRIRAEDITFF
jgi:DNA-binding NtrC family response regulator